MRDFKSSQLIELRKISKQLYDAFDSALAYRAKLIEDASATEYQYQKYNTLNDPEHYYHFKLFDKGVSIIRLYDKRLWFRKDDDDTFHFSIRCYGFKCKKLPLPENSNQSDFTYGDFKTIEDCIKYFTAACVYLVDNVYNIIDPLFKEEYVLVK